MSTILRIDASMRRDGSVTRRLTDGVIARLTATGGQNVVTRDLAEGIEQIDEGWIGANFTDPAERTEDQRARLAYSNTLVAELRAADTVVIGLPIYNFGVPAALKAWFDQIARARETFRYTENGPAGLLTGKRVIVVLASGGTAIDSAVDFATPWLRHMFGFVGIEDVTIIPADALMTGDADAIVGAAEEAIGALAA